DGEVKTVDMFVAPEAVHYGVDAPDPGSDEFFKDLRDRSGEMQLEAIRPIPWSNESKGAIDIVRLAELMKQRLAGPRFTGAQFALQMIEGVERVRFCSSG